MECGRGFFVAMNGFLNSAQARSLHITLQMLEERLRRADAWLAGTEESGLVYHRTLALPPENRAAARIAISEALETLSSLAETFAVGCKEEDLVNHIRADMSASWTDLCDTRSEKLQRYGEVHPALAELLDPDIERLAALALRIAALMNADTK
jgi:hypothetical protein